MAPVPKKKHTRGRAGRRRAQKKLSLPNLDVCSNCKKLRPSHRVCPHCGYYKHA